jgi:hypothetical protein
LNPTIKVHRSIPPSKLLGPKDREEQIDDQNKSDDDSYDVSHLLKPFTSAGVEKAKPEKNDRDKDINKVDHE